MEQGCKLALRIRGATFWDHVSSVAKWNERVTIPTSNLKAERFYLRAALLLHSKASMEQGPDRQRLIQARGNLSTKETNVHTTRFLYMSSRLRRLSESYKQCFNNEVCWFCKIQNKTGHKAHQDYAKMRIFKRVCWIHGLLQRSGTASTALIWN